MHTKRILMLTVTLLSVTVASGLVFNHSDSPDLMALWMAGDNFQSGQLDRLYASDTTFFSITPPAAWVSDLKAEGYIGAVYPYIYPPLWAALVGGLTPYLSLASFNAIASFVNPMLLGLMVILAWRAVRSQMSPLVYLFLGVLIFSLTVGGLVALQQNQLHILVSFLIVLAAERTVNGGLKTAGAALALAAAIKLFPLLFAVIWIARRQWQALAAFTVVGGALGLLSIALAGWPLHVLFLEQVSLISKTVILTNVTYSLDALFGWSLPRELFTLIVPAEIMPAHTEQTGGWFVLRKSALWQLASSALLMGALTFVFLTARKLKKADDLALVWVLAILLFNLLNSLSWAYYYLPALAFLPAIATRLPSISLAVLAAAIVAGPNLAPVPLAILNHTQSVALIAIVSILSMVAYLLLTLVVLSIKTQRH